MININTATFNSSTNHIQNDITKIANPKETEKTVNKFIQDVYENDINTGMQEIANFHHAVGFMQIAGGALQNISDNVSQIKTLQVAANNATLNSDNLSVINSQINSLSQNINNTLNNTTYNNKNVFGEFNFNGTNVNTTMPNEFSVENINDFEKSLHSALSSIGSFTNEANSKINNLSEFVTNTSNAKSLNETDIAKTVTNMKNEQIKLNAALLTQAHTNQLNMQNIINLLNEG